MQEAMRCLQMELIDSPADIKAHRVLLFMVQSKLADLQLGRHGLQVFGRSALLLNVEGDLKGQQTNPARWLPPGSLENFLKSRQVSLEARLRACGIDSIPVVRTNEGKGGKGIERAYWLDVAPLPSVDADIDEVRPWNLIEYHRSAPGEVKPSWLMRMIFRKGELRNRSWRGRALIGAILLGLVLLTAWFLTGMWGMASTDEGLTLRQLLGVSVMISAGWLTWANFYSPWIRLVDDRVVKAPQALLSLWEDSAELEMHRDSEKQQWTRFVRFSGDCPMCSGRVLLMPGKPDHKTPIVGRCSESPHSHVFSFDRARLSGVYIGPPLSGKG
mgnify:CR=1 FL=1